MEKLWVSGREAGKGSFLGLCWELPGWGGSQSSDQCTDNTAGRCDSLEEDPVLLWDEGRVLLMAIFTYFILFLFWWTLLAAVENPFSRGWHWCPGGSRGVKCLCCRGKWLVWWLCWGGWGDASSGEVLYWGQKWVRHHWEQHVQLW